MLQARKCLLKTSIYNFFTISLQFNLFNRLIYQQKKVYNCKQSSVSKLFNFLLLFSSLWHDKTFFLFQALAIDLQFIIEFLTRVTSKQVNLFLTFSINQCMSWLQLPFTFSVINRVFPFTKSLKVLQANTD